jgi:SAM-dependent methyltransferase
MRRKKNRGPRASRRAAPTSDAGPSELLAALALLRQRRAPYAELLARIVGETLQEFPAPRQTLGVEIGAGTGQLRDWLPAPVRSATVHTDPSPEVLRVLSAGAPDARVAVAAAEQLPFASGALGSVLALCVFDAIAAVDQSVAVAEIARVLCPGGRFVHFLDMATLLDAPFTKLVASGLIPMPNVFGDPADHDGPADGTADATSAAGSNETSSWPRDILLVRRDWLIGLLDFTLRLGHPLPHRFAPYFGAFVAPAGAFDVKQATDRFKALASSGEERQAFAELLTSACQLAFQSGYPAIAPLPFHSGRYLASVLGASFRENGAFHISRCEISARSLWRPPPPGEATRYRSLCLGHQRVMDHLPGRLLSESARVCAADWTSAPAGLPARKMLVEAGVFVFVATRL